MHVLGESDSSIVPKKQANNDSGPLSAESVEGRGLTKENVLQTLLAPDSEPWNAWHRIAGRTSYSTTRQEVAGQSYNLASQCSRVVTIQGKSRMR